MISPDSDLYRAHPDWAIQIPGRTPSLCRNQCVLDLSRPEVVDYVYKMIYDILSSANIAYVKWDMNRTFSDYYSQNLPAAQQGEVAHRYVLGLYRCMEELTRRFPEILFEGCAAGGNRFAQPVRRRRPWPRRRCRHAGARSRPSGRRRRFSCRARSSASR